MSLPAEQVVDHLHALKLEPSLLANKDEWKLPADRVRPLLFFVFYVRATLPHQSHSAGQLMLSVF
jgi:hypothetical protein